MLRNALWIALAAATLLPAHDFYSTKITWSREISRVVVKRCLGCHQEGGKAFSLATFDDARPWAKAMKEEVINRRMPPWGVVKGYGEFKDDPSLTQEEISLISDWVEGGAPEGEKIYLPEMRAQAPHSTEQPKGRTTARTVSGSDVLTSSSTLLAISPQQLGAPAQVVAQLPDGSVQPLIWVLVPQLALKREYQYENGLTLPKGTRIIAPQGTWRLTLR